MGKEGGCALRELVHLSRFFPPVFFLFTESDGEKGIGDRYFFLARWWFGDVYDYMRLVDKIFVNSRWNGGHGHNSLSIAPLKDNTCLIFYMDIASMLFLDVKIMPPPNHLVKGKEESKRLHLEIVIR